MIIKLYHQTDSTIRPVLQHSPTYSIYSLGGFKLSDYTDEAVV